MQSNSHKIPDNIMEHISKIRDKIEDKLKGQPTIQEQIQEYENAYHAITGQTNAINTDNSPSPTIYHKEPTGSKYIVDSYRELVEDNQNLRNVLAFFIQKLRYRDDKLMMVQIKSNDQTTSSLVNCLLDEINEIIKETKTQQQ